MAHGYAKVEGKPLAVLAHGTVGVAARRDGYLQRLLRPRSSLPHSRNIIDATKRVPGVEWAHSVQDAAANDSVTSPSGTTSRSL